MRKLALFFWGLFMFYNLEAQQISFAAHIKQNEAQFSCANSILATIPAEVDLMVDTTITTKMAVHIRGNAKYKGNYIFGSEWLVSVKHDNSLLQSRVPTFQLELLEGAFPNLDDTKNIVYKHQHEDYPQVKVKLCYWPTPEGLMPAAVMEYFSKDEKHIQIVVDAANNIMLERDLNRYFAANGDTIVRATVFMPDPITTAQTTYGGNFKDNNDADNSSLTNQLDTVEIQVENVNDTFYLRNSKVIISEISLPNVAPAFSTTDFFYTRNADAFEDVNVFYHISRQADFVASIGYGNLLNYAIPADAHALGGADQSNFSSFTFPPQLSFGEGGVDDGEDADVIIHEYGHAISFACAQNTNNGVERTAIDEGLCDYFAASYSKSISAYNWSDIFNWDGHNEFWDGRTAVTSKHYPEDIVGNLYQDAPIWSSTLMQIESDLGREICSQLLIESMFGYFNNMTMPEAAMLFLQADSALFGGTHTAEICNRFDARGILSYCTIGLNEAEQKIDFITIKNSHAFSERRDALMIEVRDSNQPLEITIYNAFGQELTHQTYASNSAEIDAEKLPSGLLIFKVNAGEKNEQFKLILY